MYSPPIPDVETLVEEDRKEGLVKITHKAGCSIVIGVHGMSHAQKKAEIQRALTRIYDEVELRRV